MRVNLCTNLFSDSDERLVCVERERERQRQRQRGEGKRKKTLALFCFSLGVRGKRTVTSVRIATVLFGIFDSVLITRHV